MKVDVSSILQAPDGVLAVDVCEPIEAADAASADQPRIVGSVQVTAELRPSGRPQIIRMTGTVSGQVEACCTRCLAPMTEQVEADLAITFGPDDDAALDGEPADGGLDPDRPDYPLTGNILDLSPVIRDALLLAIPMQWVCRPDCKGCCPTCGQDLNQGSCGCARADEPAAASPFDCLKQLL